MQSSSQTDGSTNSNVLVAYFAVAENSEVDAVSYFTDPYSRSCFAHNAGADVQRYYAVKVCVFLYPYWRTDLCRQNDAYAGCVLGVCSDKSAPGAAPASCDQQNENKIKEIIQGKTDFFVAPSFILAAYGIYAFISRGLAEYMFLKNQFVFFDFTEPLILFFIDYLAIMTLFVFVGYYCSKLIMRLPSA